MKLITLENGKALPDSRGEVAYAAEFFRWYAEEAVRNVGGMDHVHRRTGGLEKTLAGDEEFP